MSPQDQLKRAVAEAAIAYVPKGEVLGVGTGSTANFFIDALVSIKHQIPAAVASSQATAERLKKIGIEVVDLNFAGEIGLYVDGADEINSQLQMIKGGGGALTREKIVAAASKKVICIADAVPRHTYICLDYEFRQHLDNVLNMALCWSVQYWQCTARLMAANGCLLARLKDKDDIKQWALDDEIREHHAQQLAALEVALEEVCLEYHIDINTVKQIAGITNNIKFKTTPDTDYLLHIKSEMCGVLDGVKEG